MSPPGPESRRDGQVRSAFASILETLLAVSPGAVAAVFVDEEGEAVDHAGELRAYEVKLAAAHWQIVLRRATEGRRRAAAAPAGRPVERLTIDSEGRSYLAQRLFGGYVLVIVCLPRCAWAVSERALRQVELELSREAGFPLRDEQSPRWTRVRVAVDGDRQPAAWWCRGQPSEVLEVVEPLPGLADFERGFRVRSASGAQFRLVREPSGAWYASEAQ